MRSLKVVITALLTASVALGSAAPALADPHHRGKHWHKHKHKTERVVVIDRRDYRDYRDYRRHSRDHGRYYHAPPRKVVVYKDGGRYDRYDRHHHHHYYKKKDNTGDVLLGVGLGAAALAGVIAATR